MLEAYLSGTAVIIIGSIAFAIGCFHENKDKSIILFFAGPVIMLVGYLIIFISSVIFISPYVFGG